MKRTRNGAILFCRKNSLSIEPSRLMLGARTPSSAQRASPAQILQKGISRHLDSRYALSPDEGVRDPSSGRLISDADNFVG